MRFAQGQYVFLFWIIFGLALFIIFTWRKKKKLMRKFAEEKLLEEIAHSVSLKRQLVKSIIILMVLILNVLALMRPQWGFKWQKVKRRGLDILIALDVSKSMLASDVKPNRLERSKLAVKDLIKKLTGDRIGLIAFSGTAFLQCPLTVDYAGFTLALNDLSVNTIPRAGTSISNAINVATKSFEAGQKYKVLIIITDGEDHEGDPLKFAEIAKAKGIKIFCIGIGTIGGELIQITDENGKRVFLKDRQGNVVKSRLNEEVLQKIAFIGEGIYVRSSGAEFGLDYIYENKLTQMEKREIEAKMSKFYYERFQIPLAFALACLVIESFISERKKR